MNTQYKIQLVIAKDIDNLSKIAKKHGCTMQQYGNILAIYNHYCKDAPIYARIMTLEWAIDNRKRFAQYEYNISGFVDFLIELQEWCLQ